MKHHPQTAGYLVGAAIQIVLGVLCVVVAAFDGQASASLPGVLLAALGIFGVRKYNASKRSTDFRRGPAMTLPVRVVGALIVAGWIVLGAALELARLMR